MADKWLEYDYVPMLKMKLFKQTYYYVGEWKPYYKNVLVNGEIVSG